RGGALRLSDKTGQTSGELVGLVNALGGVTIDAQTAASAANTIGNLTITNLNRPIGGRVNFVATGTGNVLGGTGTQAGRIFIQNFQNGTGALAAFSSTNLNDGIINGGITAGTDFATYNDTF